jgi:hypothetical protein
MRGKTGFGGEWVFKFLSLAKAQRRQGKEMKNFCFSNINESCREHQGRVERPEGHGKIKPFAPWRLCENIKCGAA